MAVTKHGVLFERDGGNFLSELCVNRGAIFTEDVDGGAFVVLDKPNAKEPELYDVKKWTNEKTGLYVAYNPSDKYDVIGGNLYPAQSNDDRNYTNLANRAFDIFQPVQGVVFGVLQHNIKGVEAQSLVVGDYLEPDANQMKWTRKASTPTEGKPTFIVEEIGKVKYPTGTLTKEDEEKIFYVRTVRN